MLANLGKHVKNKVQVRLDLDSQSWTLLLPLCYVTLIQPHTAMYISHQGNAKCFTDTLSYGGPVGHCLDARLEFTAP